MKKTDSILKAVRNVLKISKHATSNPSLHLPYLKDGKQYFCDTFRVIVLTDPLPIETTFLGGNYPDLEKLIVGYRRTCTVEVTDIPTAEQLRSYIFQKKTERKEHPEVLGSLLYDIDGTYVNAEYLLTMLEALPYNTQMWRGKKSTEPLVFSADNGYGALMPVCRPEPAQKPRKPAYPTNCPNHKERQ